VASSEKRPLSGLRVLVTRAGEQAEAFSQQLLDRGAQPVMMPTIAMAPPERWDDVDAAIGRLDDYDGILFTSANAVEAVCGRLEALGKGAAVLSRIPQTAAIGPATAQALARHGLSADVVAEEHRAEGLFDTLLARGVRGKRFLLPCAEKARDVLPDLFAEAGARVDIVAVYRTVAAPAIPEALERLRRGDIDVVTFASPSAVENFIALSRDAAAVVSSACVAVIGPVTHEACERAGMRVDIQAAPYTLSALIEAMERHFSRRT
jgi:uroporphyrinogen-III synthase